MSWYEVNFLLGTVLSLFAGLFVLYCGQSKPTVRRTWFLLCLSISVWHAGRFLIAIAETRYVAEQTVYLNYLSAIFVPPLYLHFCVALLGDESRKVLLGGYLLAIVDLLLLASGTLTEGVRLDSSLGFYEIPTKA